MSTTKISATYSVNDDRIRLEVYEDAGVIRIDGYQWCEESGVEGFDSHEPEGYYFTHTGSYEMSVAEALQTSLLEMDIADSLDDAASIIAQSDVVMSYSEAAELTHSTQVELYGFCLCEDGGAQYDDCPVSQ